MPVHTPAAGNEDEIVLEGETRDAPSASRPGEASDPQTLQRRIASLEATMAQLKGGTALPGFRQPGIGPPDSIDENETLLSASQVRATMGGVSDMWVWRHQRDPDPETKFPDADFVLSGRRYWMVGTIRKWLAAQASRKAKTRAPVTAGTLAVLLALVLPLASVRYPISTPWAPGVTRVLDPGPPVAAATAGRPMFPGWRATACRAGVHAFEAA